MDGDVICDVIGRCYVGIDLRSGLPGKRGFLVRLVNDHVICGLIGGWFVWLLKLTYTKKN